MRSRLEKFENHSAKLRDKADSFNDEINQMKQAKQTLQDENEEFKVLNDQQLKSLNEVKSDNKKIQQQNDDLNQKFLN